MKATQHLGSRFLKAELYCGLFVYILTIFYLSTYQNHLYNKEKCTYMYMYMKAHIDLCVSMCIYTLYVCSGNKSLLTYLKLNKQFVYIFLRYFPDIHPLVIY